MMAALGPVAGAFGVPGFPRPSQCNEGPIEPDGSLADSPSRRLAVYFPPSSVFAMVCFCMLLVPS